MSQKGPIVLKHVEVAEAETSVWDEDFADDADLSRVKHGGSAADRPSSLLVDVFKFQDQPHYTTK